MEMTSASSDLAPVPAYLLQLLTPARAATRDTNVAPFGFRDTTPGSISPYSRKALKIELVILRQTAVGARNHALNRGAFSLGQLVGGDALPRSLVEDELYAAAETTGLVGDDGEASVRATIRSGLEAGIKEPRRPDTPVRARGAASHRQPDSLPEIHITTQVKQVTDRAIDALLRHAHGQIFQKGRILVRVIRDARELKKLTRPPDAPVIDPIPAGRLLELMASSAQWLRVDKRSGALEPALPPKAFVQVLGDRGEWPFSYLESVSEVPVLRSDGTILEDAGYDDATGILFLPNASFPMIPRKPTREDARQALVLLYEPFMEFPFKTQADASVLISGILTVLARPAILGPTPMFTIRKNAPGVGGSLIVDGISLITTGRVAARMTLTSDPVELRKLILTLAIEGTPIVLFDNLEGAVGSAVLAAALTADTWSDRLLGFNKKVTAPLRLTWFATGNGLSFKRDLGRRVALCDMVSNEEHPEDRDDFRHRDLLAYLSESRPTLVCAALTLLRAYFVAGRPAHGKTRKGGFTHWDDLVRGALVWAGAEDPMGTTARVRADADTDLAALSDALAAWSRVFEEAVTTAQAAERSRSDSDLRAALAALGGCATEKVDSQNLGYALRKYKDRIASGRCFTKVEDDDRKAGLWTVREI